jgi:hypothetical protein
MELADILKAASDLGTTGILVVGIVAFFKGKILPRSVVDEIKEHGEAQTKLLAQELQKGFADAVKEAAEAGAKEGAIAALAHINGDNE